MRPVWISVSVSKNSSSVPKPPGKMATALARMQEMHLADREIVEVEAELRRDVGVGRLLVRQHDVEADRRRADIGGAAVARLHDARPAAGHHDEFAVVERGRMSRAQAGELARLVVVAAVGSRLRLLRLVASPPRRRLPGSGMRAPPNSTTVEWMPRSAQRHLGLQQFELQPDRRAVRRRVRNSVVGIGEPIGRRRASAACRGTRLARSHVLRRHAAAASMPVLRRSDPSVLPVLADRAVPWRGAIDPSGRLDIGSARFPAELSLAMTLTARCTGDSGHGRSAALETTIDAAFEARDDDHPLDHAARCARRSRRRSTCSTAARRASPSGRRDGSWTVNQWLKKAVLLSFRLNADGDHQGRPGRRGLVGQGAVEVRRLERDRLREGRLPRRARRRSSAARPISRRASC